jgi:predicted RNA-binding Zn ribbon-like protein
VRTPPPLPLWLAFVNTEARAGRGDALASFDAYVRWLQASGVLGDDRAAMLRRRAPLQPAGATAALLEARRMRAALALLTDHTLPPVRGRDVALAEVNRLLGRTAGMRHIAATNEGRFQWEFVPTGDAFAGLLLPVVESATDSLVGGLLPRVRRCAAPDCRVAFVDGSKNGSRRWCTMRGCGNRAKQARARRSTGTTTNAGGRHRSPPPDPLSSP